MGKNTVVIYITAKRIGLKGGEEVLKCANPNCTNMVTFKQGDYAISKVSHGLRKLYCEECAVELAIKTRKEIDTEKRTRKCLSTVSR
jgi:aspartate carbamoyltransferase regulatory subunit